MTNNQRTVAAAVVEHLQSAAPCSTADQRFAAIALKDLDFARSIAELPDSYELSIKQEYALWRIAERYQHDLTQEAAAIIQARCPRPTSAPPKPQYPLRRRGHR